MLLLLQGGSKFELVGQCWCFVGGVGRDGRPEQKCVCECVVCVCECGVVSESVGDCDVFFVFFCVA